MPRKRAGGKYRTESSVKLKKKDIGDRIVLACTTFPEEDILIEIPEDSRLVIGDKIAVAKSRGQLEFLKERIRLSPLWSERSGLLLCRLPLRTTSAICSA